MNQPPPPEEGQVLTGPQFSEPMRVVTVAGNGLGGWKLGLVGTRTHLFRQVTLDAMQLAELSATDSAFRYDGDGELLRLGLDAHALGIAWESDPYFGLSVSRVDPLPHQLEAVYDHLLKPARVRFLLADDAGAGKTIMSGLLLRELQLRGLAERILIVAPSNLTFQWQRELREKFDQSFVVLKGAELRDAAQGRPGELLPLPPASRPRRLRQRHVHPPRVAPGTSTVLPPPHEGGDGSLPAARRKRRVGRAADLHAAHP